MKNVSVSFMDARNLAFEACSFDVAISGFMGWYDCFDFTQNKFTRIDTKSKEMWRVLKYGGRCICCSWEEQEDLRWMEEAMLRHYPAILKDNEYIARRPIGMAYEKGEGYAMIFQSAGFHEIEIFKEEATFVSTDEEEWWQQMREVGWHSLIENIERDEKGRIQSIKEASSVNFNPISK